MAIFQHIEIEESVQVNDKTRINASKSFVSKDEAAITLVRIKPIAAGSFIDVFTGAQSNADYFLDWEYTTEETVTVEVEITTDGAPESETKTLEVLAVATDKLFSKDSDLQTHEPDILEFTRPGRNSFLDVHRRAQKLIMAWFDENGYFDSSGDKLTLDALLDVEETRQWSTYLALRLIMEGISNDVDDVFNDKKKKYQILEERHRNRFVFRLDLDGDDVVDTNEGHGPILIARV